MVLRWNTIGWVAAVALLAGCEGQPRDFEELVVTEEAETPAPPAAEVPAGEEAREIPEILEKAEKTSVDLQDEIMDEDWDDAEEKTRELQSLSDSIRATGAPAAEVSAYDSAVAELAQKVERRDQVAAGMAANSVNRAVIEMMDDFRAEVPVEVRELAVETREITYRAAAGEWDAATRGVETLKSNYGSVQGRVAQRDADLDGRVRGSIDELERAVAAKDPEAVKEAAKKVHDEVDKVIDAF